MSTTHTIKTWKPFFQDILDGKKPFEFRLNDRGYQVGDEINHIEYDKENEKETGRKCWATIAYIIHGGQFGIPEGCCVFTQHTIAQVDFVRDYDILKNIVLPEYEDKLNSKLAGNIIERLRYVLQHFNSAANNSIWKAKNFIDDVKTQFKALELIVEGITGHGNHTEKRVIANHVITMLRQMVDKIDHVDWDYSSGMYERYNFFRSNSPEGDLMKRYKELKEQHERLQQEIKSFKAENPGKVD